MKKFDFNIFFIVPITHKIIPLNIKYQHKTLFEYIAMPWETGISKNVKFSTLLENTTEDIDISKLKIINSLNKTPVILESVSINGQVQNISSHAPDKQKHIYLDTFFKSCEVDATIFKIMNLPETIHLSHSYFCNGNQYIPKCDRHHSTLSFEEESHLNFSFQIQCFDTSATECLCYLECTFNKGDIETKVYHKDSHDIQALHDKLKTLYKEVSEEEFIDIATTDNDNFKLIPDIATDVASILRDIDNYSVIKIEGLPKNITHDTQEIFYQNNAYYISNQDKKLCEYLLAQAYEDHPITISYFKEDTLEPILQKTLRGPIFEEVTKKTA